MKKYDEKYGQDASSNGDGLLPPPLAPCHLCIVTDIHAPNRFWSAIDPDALTTHLEAALSCALEDTLAALQDTDRQRRRRATYTLAHYLADRLGCFEITGEGLGDDVGKQASLFR